MARRDGRTHPLALQGQHPPRLTPASLALYAQLTSLPRMVGRDRSLHLCIVNFMLSAEARAQPPPRLALLRMDGYAEQNRPVHRGWSGATDALIFYNENHCLGSELVHSHLLVMLF